MTRYRFSSHQHEWGLLRYPSNPQSQSTCVLRWLVHHWQGIYPPDPQYAIPFLIFLITTLISETHSNRVGYWVYGLLGCIVFSALISELFSDVVSGKLSIL